MNYAQWKLQFKNLRVENDGSLAKFISDLILNGCLQI